MKLLFILSVQVGLKVIMSQHMELTFEFCGSMYAFLFFFFFSFCVCVCVGWGGAVWVQSFHICLVGKYVQDQEVHAVFFPLFGELGLPEYMIGFLLSATT